PEQRVELLWLAFGEAQELEDQLGLQGPLSGVRRDQKSVHQEATRQRLVAETPRQIGLSAQDRDQGGGIGRDQTLEPLQLLERVAITPGGGERFGHAAGQALVGGSEDSCLLPRALTLVKLALCN